MTAHATTGALFFAWSLAVEEQFYLFFSPAMRFLRNRSVALIVFGALLLKPAEILFCDMDRSAIGWRIALSYQEGILWGVLVAFALRSPKTYRFVSWTSKPLPLILNALFSISLLMFYELHDKSGPITQLLFLSVAILVAGLSIRPRIAILGNWMLIHIGKVSYGIYLFHMTLIILTRKILLLIRVPCSPSRHLAP